MCSWSWLMIDCLAIYRAVWQTAEGVVGLSNYSQQQCLLACFLVLRFVFLAACRCSHVHAC